MTESLQIFTDDIDSLTEGHRGLTELLHLWKSLCGDRAMPQRSDFDPAQVPRLLANICLVEVIDGGADYFYRVAGSGLEEMSGQKLQGKLFSEVEHAAARESMRRTCESCVAAGRPVIIKNQLQEPGHDHMAITAVILPLSEDGETVDMLLTLTEYQSVT